MIFVSIENHFLFEVFDVQTHLDPQSVLSYVDSYHVRNRFILLLIVFQVVSSGLCVLARPYDPVTSRILVRR